MGLDMTQTADVQASVCQSPRGPAYSWTQERGREERGRGERGKRELPGVGVLTCVCGGDNPV